MPGREATHHPDFGEGIAAVVEQVARLPAVDAHDAKQELSAET